jgi:hypothetical protein
MSGWGEGVRRITASPRLNTFFSANPNLFAIVTNKINQRGQIWACASSARARTGGM